MLGDDDSIAGDDTEHFDPASTDTPPPPGSALSELLKASPRADGPFKVILY